MILLYLMRINKLPLNVMEKDFIVELRKLKKIWKDSVYYNVLDGSLFAFVVVCIIGIKTVPWKQLLKS